MKTLLLLLALALALPPALADHRETCGASDGHLGETVYLWLEPGCVGAYTGIECWSNIVLAHGQVVGAETFVWICGAGVWFP